MNGYVDQARLEGDKRRQSESPSRADGVVCDRCGGRSEEVWLHISGGGICQSCTREPGRNVDDGR